jgi:hypothetical protein
LFISAANAPRFAYDAASESLSLKAHGSAADYILRQTFDALLLTSLDLFFQNTPINWAVMNGNGN